jgi:hypothetical protein
MPLIYTGINFVTLFIIQFALTLAIYPWVRPYSMAKAAGLIGIPIVFFFFEYFIGLGKLFYLFPFLVIGACWVFYKNRQILLSFWKEEALFLALLSYGMMWRFLWPDIDTGRPEAIMNLSFITSFMRGETLPPPDFWYPPLRLDCYYAFSHYFAGFWGRLFGWTPGTAMNFALILVIGLTGYLACAAAKVWSNNHKWAVPATILGFVLGGTGIHPFLLWIFKNPTEPWMGFRFIGGSIISRADQLTPFGESIKTLIHGAQPNPLDLPCENFAYLAQLGDYHAPLFGFMVLILTLLSAALLWQDGKNRCAAICFGSMPFLCIASNTWGLPFQGLLFASYIPFIYKQKRDFSWLYLLYGILGGLVLFYPFLEHFLPSVWATPSAFKITKSFELTPSFGWLMLFWPVVVLLVITCLTHRKQPIGIYWATLWVFFLICTEFIYVDDIYSGKYERFNTVLKWWPLIFAGVMTTCVPLVLAHASKLYRAFCLAIVFAVATFAIQLAIYLVITPKWDIGKMTGDAWLTRYRQDASILYYLRDCKYGVTLQSLDKGSYTSAPALAIFSQKPVVLGWREHEKLWRPQCSDFDKLFSEIQGFYDGSLINPLGWAQAHRICYILWTKEEAQKYDDTRRQAIQNNIAEGFNWLQLSEIDSKPVGMWIKKGY